MNSTKTCRIDFRGFSIVHNHENKGIEIMALSERESETKVELPQPPQGFEADSRYQRIIELADSMSENMLKHLIETLKDRIQSIK